MKWNNRGHQLELLQKSILDRCSKGVFLYGAGIRGEHIARILGKKDILKGFVDNDILKQGRNWYGLPVISYEHYIKKYKSCVLVLCMSEYNIKIVEQELVMSGKKNEEDFFLYEKFLYDVLPVILWFKYRNIFLPSVQISLTERCTLRCKKCAHGCFNVSMDYPDLSIERACVSADNFFRYVDYVDEFILLGGEPLLYKDLSKVIKYIGEHYRDKINKFVIISNGTIVPSNELLLMCKIHNVVFRISNYTASLPRLKKQHEKIYKKMSFYGVKMILGEADQHWMDYGFDYVKRDCNENELISVFDTCHTICNEVQDDKFYYCVMAHTVANNLHFNVGRDDYFRLENLVGRQLEKNKVLFLEYTLGYSDKGYLDMCRYCNGADAKKYLIPVAEQV